MSELYLLCCWLNILGFYILAFVPTLTSYSYNFVCVYFLLGRTEPKHAADHPPSFSDTCHAIIYSLYVNINADEG